MEAQGRSSDKQHAPNNPNQPRHKRKRGANKQQAQRRPGSKKQQHRSHSHQQQLGFFGAVPSLQELQRENRKRARRHFQRHGRQLYHLRRNAALFPGPFIRFLHARSFFFPLVLASNDVQSLCASLPTPLTTGRNEEKRKTRAPTPQIPPAAPTPAGGLFFGAGTNPLETPTLVNDLPPPNAVDKLEGEGLQPDLDFYGTNEGLVYYGSSSFMATSEEDPEEEEDEEIGEVDSRTLSRSQSLDKGHDDADRDELGENLGASVPQASEDNARNREPVFAGSAAHPPHTEEMQSRIIQRMREKMAKQDAWIAELEDSVLRLQDQLSVTTEQLSAALQSLQSRDRGAQQLEANDINNE
jgi:uncharacterized coiled-coil protein SlyX